MNLLLIFNLFIWIFFFQSKNANQVQGQNVNQDLLLQEFKITVVLNTCNFEKLVELLFEENKILNATVIHVCPRLIQNYSTFS